MACAEKSLTIYGNKQAQENFSVVVALLAVSSYSFGFNWVKTT